jgi:hypothetical protein
VQENCQCVENSAKKINLDSIAVVHVPATTVAYVMMAISAMVRAHVRTVSQASNAKNASQVDMEVLAKTNANAKMEEFAAMGSKETVHALAKEILSVRRVPIALLMHMVQRA